MGLEAAVERAEQTDKLKELILLVADLESDAELFGQVKLNKILFNIDFKAYSQWGEGVTGQEYQALPQGPALRRMVPVIEQLRQEGALAIKREDVGEYTQERPVALRPPDLGRFTAEELELIRAEAESAKSLSAADMIDVAHDFISWKVAAIGETIPYETVFAMKPRPLTEREKSRGRELIERAYGT